MFGDWGGSEEWDSEYDSTWEEEEGRGHKGRRKKPSHGHRQAFLRRARAARDLQNYRHGYRDYLGYQYNNDEDVDMPNLRFYQNKMPFQPNGERIDTILADWKEDYDLLEENHSYIQWLFPLRENGMNWHATPLTESEIKELTQDEGAMCRFLQSYRLMLGFYGIDLVDEETGEVTRADNWQERFRNLNRHSHNNLRITRILKCLGELGFERFQAPLVRFFLEETLAMGQLQSVKRSVLDYFMFTVKDKTQRQELVSYAWSKFTNKEEFIWGPGETIKRYIHDRQSRGGPNKRGESVAEAVRMNSMARDEGRLGEGYGADSKDEGVSSWTENKRDKEAGGRGGSDRGAERNVGKKESRDGENKGTRSSADKDERGDDGNKGTGSSVDKEESGNKGTGSSVDKEESGNKGAGSSVDMEDGRDKEAGRSLDKEEDGDKEAGRSVDKEEGGDKETGRSVDMEEGGDKETGRSVDMEEGGENKARRSVDKEEGGDKEAGRSVDKANTEDGVIRGKLVFGDECGMHKREDGRNGQGKVIEQEMVERGKGKSVEKEQAESGDSNRTEGVKAGDGNGGAESGMHQSEGNWDVREKTEKRKVLHEATGITGGSDGGKGDRKEEKAENNTEENHHVTRAETNKKRKMSDSGSVVPPRDDNAVSDDLVKDLTGFSLNNTVKEVKKSKLEDNQTKSVHIEELGQDAGRGHRAGSGKEAEQDTVRGQKPGHQAGSGQEAEHDAGSVQEQHTVRGQEAEKDAGRGQETSRGVRSEENTEQRKEDADAASDPKNPDFRDPVEPQTMS